MIDADRVDLAVANQLPEEPMGRVEHLLVLDAQSRERVDVEEAPVVDLVRRRPPVRQAVGLRLEQLVQPVEAGGASRRAVEPADRGVDAVPDRRRLVGQPREPCRATSFSR